MTHLTIDEMIEFVSLTELNSEALELSATVNGHIAKCERCLRLVRAFQIVYDGFSSVNKNEDFRKYVLNDILNSKGKSKEEIEIKTVFKDMEK